MKFCPVCGHENSDNAARCTNPECGYEFDTNSNNHKTRLMDGAGPDLEQGRLISDRYEIVRELGRGGMGVVYLVKDGKLRGREVALKMIHPELITHEEARQRFIDEVLLCLDLHHPNIVIVYPIEETDRNLFFTMEYIPGKCLRKLMDERQDRVPPFTLEEACSVVAQILDALEYAHQTTIHRDIKPENILIQGEFPEIQVKVLDFGIAKVLSASRFTRTAQSMGTAYYMSPEQMQGAKKIDLRSDLYSVGMILYEMLTGLVAAGRFDLPSQMVEGLPAGIDTLIEKALSPVPQRRHKTALEMKEEVLALKFETAEAVSSSGVKANEKGTDPDLIPSSGPVPARPRKSKFLLWTCFFLVLACVAGFFGYQAMTGPANSPEDIFSSVVKTVKHLGADPEPILTVNTDPPGAKVYLDRAHAGISPARIMELSPGTHEIRVEKDRYQPFIESVLIQKSTPRVVTATLVPLPLGDLKISSVPAGANVFVDGEPEGTTPLSLEKLPKGQHTVRLEKIDHHPLERTVQIIPLKTAEVSENLVYRFGALQIISRPDNAQVYIDGKKQGKTPFTTDKILTGSHEIRVTKTCYNEKSSRINIAPRESVKRDFELEKSGPIPGQNWKEQKTGMEFVWVPKGCYQMGDTFGEGYSDEKPVHEVCLDGFWMGKYEVTQAEYRKVTGKNPSVFKGDRRPVEQVSWQDAKAFISKLNSRTGQTFSLPTEAQWEYAAREGGKVVRFGTGKNTIGPDEANFNASSKYKKSYSRSGEYRKKTVNVGSFSSNSLGLYDMSGNVWEWCEDVYVEDGYKRHSKKNPVITSGGSERVLRGGSWFITPWSLRAAGRNGNFPSIRGNNFGFRLVLAFRGQQG